MGIKNISFFTVVTSFSNYKRNVPLSRIPIVSTDPDLDSDEKMQSLLLFIQYLSYKKL